MGFIIGAFLGSRLGLSGIKEFFLTIVSIPATIIKSPAKIKSICNHWHEERAKAAVERLRHKEKIKTLKERISNKKKEIHKLKNDIRRVKWQIKAPKIADSI